MSAKGKDPHSPDAENALRGFDAFEVSLGDALRGERATQGVSLLDVQRDLRIKAQYLAAIEAADAEGFDGKGFIAGYVRSYARYLNLDPDWAFEKFCQESGFRGVHGTMGLSAKPERRITQPVRPGSGPDATLGRHMPMVQPRSTWSSDLDAGALGSAAVLVALVIGLGYGAWSVVQELQRVTVVPVEATPTILAQVDPLTPVADAEDSTGTDPDMLNVAGSINAPSVDAFDRLYRPQALDIPVLVARDGPISTINPEEVGALAQAPRLLIPVVQPETTAASPQVVAEGPPEVALLAVEPAWVRVSAADGTILLEKILEPGERYVLPATEEPPTLRAGAAGAVYFSIAGDVFGPAGPVGSVASGIVLAASALRETYQQADLSLRPDLAAIVNVAEAD